MTNHEDVAKRWAKVITGQSTKEFYNDSRGNINVGGGPNTDKIFSFGWWEMARLQRDRRGKPLRFLINGQTYSNKTSQQQAIVRGAINATGLESFILPFDVLREAGIDFDTITPLEITPDTNETIPHQEREFPAGAYWEYDPGKRIPGTGVYVHKETGEALDSNPGYGEPNEYRKRKDVAEGHFEYGAPDDAPNGWKAFKARRNAFEAEWDHYPIMLKNTGRKRLKVDKRFWYEWEIVADDDTALGYSFRYNTYRHWLGGSLVMATVNYRQRDKKSGAILTKTRRARFLSGFDQNERRMSYFFCELPRTSRANTVDQALDDLKPATVKTAESLGRDVKRQGDIFAVPLPSVLTRSLKNRVKGGNLLGTNHVATETVRVNGMTLARGTLKHAPEFRAPDHTRVKLGDGRQWHLILKNTVPVTV